MVRNTFLTLAIFLIFMLFLPIESVFAFNSLTHQYLWKNAIKDINISSCSKKQQSYILNTAPVQPDWSESRKDHICYKDNCPALEKMKQLITDAKEEKDFCKKMIILGNASHYLADSEDAVHQTSESKICHQDFELKVLELTNSKTQNSFTLKCGGVFRSGKQQIFSFNKMDLSQMIFDIRSKILVYDGKNSSKYAKGH